MRLNLRCIGEDPRRIWKLFKRIRIVLEMVKIEHTIFALPFAFLGAFLAARGLPGLRQTGWIVLAMIGARSAAMAFNRLVDLPFDVRNPRTAGRALPGKKISKGFVILFIAASSAVLVLSAAMLNPLSLKLSPLALGILFFYSFTKRFTWLAHMFLGICLAGAPIGAWIAIKGSVSAAPLILGLAVALWVAGFDIIYACQDVEFDRKEPLFSIPKRFGIRASLWISGILHGVMLGILAYLFVLEGIGYVGFSGLLVVGLLLAYEHSLVRPGNLSRANTAFFTINGWISILLCVTTAIDILSNGQG
ncbi:MAG: UbiA family prenyltransferase [Acidobacteria bacterium]|nr:UbiA family prenyltransferase [Acidobacteriota bacterium]